MFFFFNDTATTEIYTLSLHDALPICASAPIDARNSSARKRRCRLGVQSSGSNNACIPIPCTSARSRRARAGTLRSEEHTSELQSRQYLVCRLLLEKKKKTNSNKISSR